MSKIPVIRHNENIQEKPILCPHNKIIGKVQKIYRVEKPVRLREVSHLRKIGQCDCPICGNSNKLLCECTWKKEKVLYNNSNNNNNNTNNNKQSQQQQQCSCAAIGRSTIASTRRTPGANDEKIKDESIFRFQTMPPPPDDYDEYPLRGVQTNGPMSNLYRSTILTGCRSTLMKKFRQGYRKSCNYFAGRIKSNESFNWIMKPRSDFHISTTDITALQNHDLTETIKKFHVLVSKNNLQPIITTATPTATAASTVVVAAAPAAAATVVTTTTTAGIYKKLIDESSGSSSLQQQQQQQIKYEVENNVCKTVDNSSNNDLVPTIMSNHVIRKSGTIKSSLSNRRYLYSIANTYPSNMLPGRSEQDTAMSPTVTVEIIKSWTTDQCYHQPYQHKQQYGQQQQQEHEERSQQRQSSTPPPPPPQQQQQQLSQKTQKIFVSPFTTIEVYDNKIDLEQIQYKPSSPTSPPAPPSLSSSSSKKQQQQQYNIIRTTNINKRNVKYTTEKTEIIATNYDKMNKQCDAKATNLCGDNFNVNDELNYNVAIPNVIAITDGGTFAKLKMQQQSFQLNNNSSLQSTHTRNTKMQRNRNTIIVDNCNGSEVISTSSDTNEKSNQTVTVTETTPIKNETTSTNSNSKTKKKSIVIKKPKRKNSKLSIKKRHVKK